MAEQQISQFNKMCKFMGTKLLLTKLSAFKSPLEYVRSETIEWLDAVQCGIRIYKPLWMDMLAARSGKTLPFSRDCGYIQFWGEVFPKGKRYYILKHKDGSLEFSSF